MQVPTFLKTIVSSVLWLAIPIPFFGIAIAIPAPTPSSVVPMTTLSPLQVLERLFQTPNISADWFTPEFLAAVPIAQIQQIVNQFKQDLGDFASAVPDGSDYLLNFSRGSVPTKIVLNDKGKIAGLLLSPARQKISSLPEAIAQFKALPGRVSILVQEGSIERASLNPDLALGVGSAFKLAVLDILRSQIAAGKLTWKKVIPLQAQYTSLPSGRLQTWPTGSYLTVQSLAAMMISESDNTATDHLLQLVGRKNVEAIAPQSRPLLMTRELFQLKAKSNQALLEQYRRGSLPQKRSILTQLAKQPLPQVAEFAEAQPKALDVEWFFTPKELCQLMERVKDLPLMAINPGVAKPEDWQKIAYKGGSEPGVLNLTTSIQTKNGKYYCVVATWNHDRPLDESKFMGLYGGLLDLLKQTDQSPR
jgi:beta-lactamase class A